MPDLIPSGDWKEVDVDLKRPYSAHADNWEIDAKAGTVVHRETPDPGFGVVTFPNRMINGELSARVTVDHTRLQALADKDKACCGHLVFRFLDSDRYYAFGIGGWRYNCSTFYRKPTMDWMPWTTRGQAGDEIHRDKQSNFDLSIRILGRTVECFINSSRAITATLPSDAPYQNGNIGLYSYKKSPVAFSNIRLRLAPLKCFIASPINDIFDKSVYYFVKKAIEELKVDGHTVTCYRADDNSRSEPFIRTIIEQMQLANVTVVLVPGKDNLPENLNENVFYELGMAHAMGLPTVAYAEDHRRMPANLRHLNIITNPAQLVRSVREILSKDTYNQVHVA